MLVIYRILSFILLPIAALFGLITLIFLLGALANPSMLLGVFILACVTIYSFAAFSFLNKIERSQKAKPSLKDWVKVNAFVSMLFAILSLLQSIQFFLHPALSQQLITQALDSQKNAPASVTPELMQSILRGALYFIIIYCTLLLVHIFMSFRLLKERQDVFETEKEV